jgi:hypothetical protein
LIPIVTEDPDEPIITVKVEPEHGALIRRYREASRMDCR